MHNLHYEGSCNYAIHDHCNKGHYELDNTSRYVNVVVEPVIGYSDHIAMARSYGILKPGRGKIDVCLRNHSAKQITLPKWTAMGEITAAYVILALLVLKPTGNKSGKGKATTQKWEEESQKELLDKIDLTGLRNCSQDEKKRHIMELLTVYTSISSVSNIDLGKASLVKHSIRLMDNAPFKEYYWQIPPGM